MIQLSLGHRGRALELLRHAHDLNPWFSIEYAPVLDRTLARLDGGR
jgi:hypothetical protein